MLAKKFIFSEEEKKIQEFWDQEQVYKFDINSDKEIYSIDTPPPTVSGKQHIGHIFSYTQAEMIARYQRMMGKNVFYPFGFDDNGLPTERLVERELDIIGRDLPRSEFRAKCLKTTEKYEEEFKALWQSLGFSCDWDQSYRTISDTSQRISQRSFIELAHQGKAYLEESPVLWCTHCRTSIAQAELESKEMPSTFNTIIFQIEGENIEISTTRPELLYGCVALFINPRDEKNKRFIGKEATVPLYGFKVPILQDDKVDMEKGTGMVMCCTFGDTTDLEWFKEYDLPFKKIVEGDGRINTQVPNIGGMFVKAGRKRILEALEAEGLLVKQEPITHPVSTHERCGTSVEIIPSQQWYIDIISDKDKFLKAADEINWYPGHMKKRYVTWVENLKWNWCVSRQRYFGVPIPAWYCESCGATHLADLSDLPVNPIETELKITCKCGSDKWRPETAVLDTWATSSVTPQINSKWGEDDDRSKAIMPMGLRTQAHEIIRTWAFYTIVKSIYHTGQIPWKDMMICGFVLAKKGEKISKSKKNGAVSPKNLIEKYSADAVRYWAANSRLGTDMMFSEDELQGSKRFLTKLWNASKFSLMHLGDYQGETPNKLLPQDKWIMDRYDETLRECQKHLDNYEVGLARLIIDEFFWKDYCDHYLELVKDRVYKPEVYGEANRRSGQYALYNTLLGILKIYALFTPHITDSIYQSFYREREDAISIHLTELRTISAMSDDSLNLGRKIKLILSEARKYKSERNLSMKDVISAIKVSASMNIDNIDPLLMDLKACTKAETIEFGDGDDFKVTIE